MAIPLHLLDSATRHKKAGKTTALLVRHSERYPLHDLRTHEQLLLTVRGHEMAREGGALLAARASRLRVLHSPVERCAETARGLVAGALHAGAQAVVEGGLPGIAAPFILDRERAFALAHSTGPRFIREWFDGKLPADVVQGRHPAAHGQLDAITEHVRKAHGPGDDDTLWVFVSHDWNIALIREEVLGVRPEGRWPAFLDGVVVVMDDEGVLVEFDGHVGRSGQRQLG